MTIHLRLRAVERLIGSRLGTLGADAIRSLVGFAETDQLDFKLQWPADQEDLAHDICCFANGRGGVVLIGVEESEGVATSAAGSELPRGELRARVAQILQSHCRPVPPFELATIDAGDERVFIGWRCRRAPTLRTRWCDQGGTARGWYFPCDTEPRRST